MKRKKRPRIKAMFAVAAAFCFWAFFLMIFSMSTSAQLATEILPPGWQFYSNPTTLEPPGTVFRIDPHGRRYLVNVFEVAPLAGRESVGRSDKFIETDMNALAKIWGIVGKLKGSGSGNFTEKLKFSMNGAKREATTDVAVEKILSNFAKKTAYKKDNRYFLIRESLSATEMEYALSESFISRIGGEGSFKAMFSGKGDISFKKGKEYILEQKFPERMRVMFLAEEIVPAPKSLSEGAPAFESQPVKEILKWED